MKLEIGYNHDFEVREEVCTVAAGRAFTVLYLSDLHLTGFSGPTVARLMATIDRLNPRVLLLGGDYVDSAAGFRHFTRFVEFIAGRENVFVIAGNHDVFFGVQKIKQLVEANHLVWLADEPVRICLDGRRVQITNNGTSDRPEDVDFSVLCLHQPVDVAALPGRYELAFAGHLHGSQVVLWRSGQGLFPGRLFYRWNRLKTTVGNCLYLISKGLGDTLPLRYNCKKDVVFVTVKPHSQRP
ncbi:metallophosphoesterase [Hymenobacter monticola]|uniref:Metallophosphoesterase n=1 Tax=Hymenobacter monticola TaxID=1705399 RepID=A0ABY4B9F6_9BACT|nr:metallophosphoesterase [Hymenobacter monticola]UOE34616.1 metallophosphoesterase [Hymenobacter monticola]